MCVWGDPVPVVKSPGCSYRGFCRVALLNVGTAVIKSILI